MRTQLREFYKTGKEVIKLLEGRYGLNRLGVKKLLKINTSRYNKIASGELQFNSVEKNILTTAFSELEGRI